MNVQDQPHVKVTDRRSLASIRRPTQDEAVSVQRADLPMPYHYPLSTIDVTVRSAPSLQKRLYPKNVNSLSRCQSVRKASGYSCCRIGAALGRASDRCARGLRRREVGSAIGVLGHRRKGVPSRDRP